MKTKMHFEAVLFEIYIVFLALSFARFFSEKGVHNAPFPFNIRLIVLFLTINFIVAYLYFHIYKTNLGSHLIKIFVLVLLIFSPLVVYNLGKVYFNEQLCEHPNANGIHTNFMDAIFPLPNSNEYLYEYSDGISIYLLKSTRNVCSPNEDI